VRAGLLLFGLGLAKKTLVADSLATCVNRYLDDPASLHAFEAWVAIVGFGFQIYFDFSAYSDMALGLARIFGIELPWNFNPPVPRVEPDRVLAPLARDALHLAARLPLHPARRQPEGRAAA
jgi:alginate O-acetyltransferase complex protein AlgI